MVRRLKLYFLVLIMVVGVIPMESFAVQQSLRERFNQDIRHVFALERNGKPEEAIKLWESLQSEYGNLDGRYEDELGKLLARNNKFNQAETVLISGIELDGNYPPLYNTLAMVYVELDKIDKAIEIGLSATKKFPEWSGSYRMLAYAYNERKMYSEAIEMVKRAVGIKPEALSYHILASAYYHLGDYEKTVNAYSVAIVMDPGYIRNHDATVMYVQSLSNVGQHKEALLIIEEYRKYTGDRSDSIIAQLEKEIEKKLSE